MGTVIEHLDPQPLSQFAPILLGKMKPKICVITTPNRDFNKVFEIPFTPLSRSPIVEPAEENSNLPSMDGIVEGEQSSLYQPHACVASRHSLIEALEAAAKSLGDRVDRNTMSEDPPSRTSSPSAGPNTIPGDSESRYWRPGIPYPMRHHDHRFEWTRAEFRAWARTSAEQFGYDVSFTGVGGFDRGMNVVGGTGYAIDRSLEEAAEEFTEGGLEGDTGEDLNLSNGLEELFSSQVNSFSELGKKARAVFGDCSQIAVFVIKQDVEEEWDKVEGFPTSPNTPPDVRIRSGSRTEGTAEPIFPNAWAPLMTPDNWFSLPYFTVPDIRLVCHYSYPWVKNEEFPPNYMHIMEMVQATFITYVPAMVVKEWQKTPAILIRERRARKAEAEGIRYRSTADDMDIDPYDFIDPPTAEVLAARRVAKREEKEKDALRIKEQTSVMRGMAPEKVEVVKMVIGARRIWEDSHAIKRACHFHYDVFRRILASSAPEGMMSLAADLEMGDEGEWITIIDTTNPNYGSEEDMHIQLTQSDGYGVIKATVNAHAAADKRTYNNTFQTLSERAVDSETIPNSPPQAALEYSSDPEAFWGEWDNSGDCTSACTASDQEDYVHDEQFGHWYHNDNDSGERLAPLKLHTIAVWGIDVDEDLKGKGKEGESRRVRVHDAVRASDEVADVHESVVLRVGKNGGVYGEKEEWEEGDVPILMTWYRPVGRITYENFGEDSCTGEEEGVDEYSGWNTAEEEQKGE